MKDFVNAASKCDFDIDIAYNRYAVDAKSIVGVFGLDFSQILTVSYSGHDADFEQLPEHFPNMLYGAGIVIHLRDFREGKKI